MKASSCLLALLVLLPAAAAAQPARLAAHGEPAIPLRAAPVPADARTAVYVEAGGNALLYSVNVERHVGRRGLIRVGLGVVPVRTDGTVVVERPDGAVAVIPVMAGLLLGTGPHRAELAGGLTLGAGTTETDDDATVGAGLVGATGTVGYRTPGWTAALSSGPGSRPR